jgi:hypothetical protein
MRYAALLVASLLAGCTSSAGKGGADCATGRLKAIVFG